MSLLPLLFACTAKTVLDTDTTDSGLDSGDTDSEDTDSGSYVFNGTQPDAPVSAPEFTVQNMDGDERTRDDLIGQPTVMWFYPAAGTAG